MGAQRTFLSPFTCVGDGRMSQTYHCATLYGYKTDSLIDRQQKRVQTHGHAYLGWKKFKPKQL